MGQDLKSISSVSILPRSRRYHLVSVMETPLSHNATSNTPFPLPSLFGPGRARETAELGQMPASLLEYVLPGYKVISTVAWEIFHTDISVLVSLGAFLVAFQYIAKYMYESLYRKVFYQYFMCSIHVDDGDEIFADLMRWMAEQHAAKRARSIKAVTRRGADWDFDDLGSSDDGRVQDANGLFNFHKWTAEAPPRYEPYFGDHWFWHGNRPFVFRRTRKDTQRLRFGMQRGSDEEYVEISCTSFSTAPIKSLLEEVKRWNLDKKARHTVVRRPRAADMGRGGRGTWQAGTRKPSRPLSTVALDEEQKEVVVQDMNDYLQPSTARWYASRGIPHRRGYLFHGPPGTGKTSLTYALAGFFRLDIYCVSLSDSNMTEDLLNSLFTDLPARCIVLLEDIDTAGIRDEAVAAAGAHEPAQSQARESRAQKPISFSGLLNVIDGVASSEGRVLVMTTNHPDRLDPALIRPGRVDMQIRFKLASRAQAGDLFRRMYTPDHLPPLPPPSQRPPRKEWRDETLDEQSKASRSAFRTPPSPPRKSRGSC